MECLCGKKATTIIHGMGECCINNKDWDCKECGKYIDFMEGYNHDEMCVDCYNKIK